MAKEGSSDRIDRTSTAKEGSSSDRIEERVLAHKWLASIACAVVAVLVLLPVYAERVVVSDAARAASAQVCVRRALARGCATIARPRVRAARMRRLTGRATPPDGRPQRPQPRVRRRELKGGRQRGTFHISHKFWCRSLQLVVGWSLSQSITEVHTASRCCTSMCRRRR